MADPKPPVTPEAAIPVVTQSGKAGYLPAEFARDAGASGIRRATPDQMATEQLRANQDATSSELRAKFETSFMGSLEGQVAPQIAGMLRGLSVGTSDAAILKAAELLGGDGARESARTRLNDYKAYAPVMSAASEMGGAGLGALVGDEAVFGKAPAMIGKLGAGAEELAAGMLGGGKLARGVGALARGGVEGAAFGAGSAYSEASLSNHELTGEALIGGAAHGALGGAVAAGVFGGAAKALGALRKGVAPGAEAMAEHAFGEAAPGVGGAIADAESAIARAADGPYRKPSIGDVAAKTYIDNLPSASPADRVKYAEAWGAREQVLQKSAESVENASRGLSTSLDEALIAGRKVDMASFGEAKINHMAQLVDRTRSSEQASLVHNWVSDADPMIQSLRMDPNSSMTAGDLKQWNGWVKEVRGAIQGQDSISMQTTLDQMKRWMGKQADFGSSPFVVTRAAREFDSLYHGSDDLKSGGLKGLLESDVWGERAARAQRDVNAATTNLLSEGKRFSRNYTTEGPSELGRTTYVADTSKVSGFMNRLTSASNDLDAKSLEGWVSARKHFLDATERSYEHAAGTKEAIATERAALERLDGVYRKATKDVSLANQVKAALEEERQRGMGGAIGAVLDVASKPYTTLQRLAQIETQTKGVLNKIGIGASELVGAPVAAKTAQAAQSSGASFFTSLLDGLRPGSAGASALGASASRTLFERRSDQIGALNGSPLAVADRVEKSLGPVASASPSVVREATGVALRGLDFLSGKLPPSRQDPYSIQPQFQPRTRASDAEISRFMRYAQAVDNPLIVLHEAKSGTLTRDHVEAVKAVYPKLYDEMRGSVMSALVESKSELPYARRIQLGILLDIPTDSTLSPDFIRAVQATFPSVDQAGAESPHPTGAAPEIASSMQTATQMATERAL